MPNSIVVPLTEVFSTKRPEFELAAVYIARDENNVVQYVGETACGVKARWYHHKYDKPGKKARPMYYVLNSGQYDVSKWTLEIIVYKSRKVKHHLLKTESRLIQRYQPLLNIKGV